MEYIAFDVHSFSDPATTLLIVLSMGIAPPPPRIRLTLTLTLHRHAYIKSCMSLFVHVSCVVQTN